MTKLRLRLTSAGELVSPVGFEPDYLPLMRRLLIHMSFRDVFVISWQVLNSCFYAIPNNGRAIKLYWIPYAYICLDLPISLGIQLIGFGVKARPCSSIEFTKHQTNKLNITAAATTCLELYSFV